MSRPPSNVVHLGLAATLAAVAIFSACSGRSASTDNGSSQSSGSASTLDDAATPREPSDASAQTAHAGAADAGGAEFRPLASVSSEAYRAMFARAAAAYARNDFTEAAREFRALYESAPSVEMAYNLGRVYERMGESGDAIHFFQRVLQGQPPPSDAQRTDIEGRIARLRAYEERRAAGIAAAPASQSELNQEGVTWFQRGVRLFQRGQYQAALQAFEQASRFLQSPELDFNLGMTYERLRNYPRAAEYLRQYLETRRGTPEEQPLLRRIRDLESR